MTTVPLAGWVTEVMLMGPPSMSVSLASTSIAVALASSSTVAGSFTATGGESTDVTVMVRLWGALVSTPPSAVPPLSDRVRLRVAEPLALLAGVKVRVPLVASAGPALNRPGLVLPVRLKVRLWPDSLAGPAEMAVAQAVRVWGPAFSRTVGSVPAVKLGGSLTGVTLMTQLWAALVSTPPLAVPPSSDRVRVRVAEPLALLAGVKVRVPSAATAGPALNRPVLVLAMTLKVRVCPASAGDPALMPVAQPGKVWAPASSRTV